MRKGLKIKCPTVYTNTDQWTVCDFTRRRIFTRGARWVQYMYQVKLWVQINKTQSRQLQQVYHHDCNTHGVPVSTIPCNNTVTWSWKLSTSHDDGSKVVRGCDHVGDVTWSWKLSTSHDDGSKVVRGCDHVGDVTWSWKLSTNDDGSRVVRGCDHAMNHV